jgi:hypothetical protein
MVGWSREKMRNTRRTRRTRRRPMSFNELPASGRSSSRRERQVCWGFYLRDISPWALINVQVRVLGGSPGAGHSNGSLG